MLPFSLYTDVRSILMVILTFQGRPCHDQGTWHRLHRQLLLVPHDWRRSQRPEELPGDKPRSDAQWIDQRLARYD